MAYTFLHDTAPPEAVTFGKLAARVAGVADALRGHAGPGDRALLLYPQGLDFVVAFLGCLAAGVVAVPAYPPRKNRKAERLAGIVADCTPAVILADGGVAAGLDAEFLRASGGPAVLTPSSHGVLGPAGVTAASPAFLQYTSGSTGTPKGVVVTHGNIAANEEQIRAAFAHTPDSVVVSWLPLFHDMGLVGGVLQPLYVGFPAVLMSPATFLQEPWRWLKAVSDYKATTTGAPNFAYDHCAKTITAEQKAGLDLSSLRVVYNGAEPVRAETLDRFAAAFSGCGFDPAAFFPCYGLAEATLFVSGGPPGEPPARSWVSMAALEAGYVENMTARAPGGCCLVSSGQVSEGAEVVAVDPQTRAVLPPGRVGALWVASPSVANGYWGRPTDTRAAFENHDAEGRGPYVDTGDLGFVRGGEVYVTGRVKDLIIVRGRNIYPQDVEAIVSTAAGLVEPNGCASFGVTVGAEERLAVVAEANRGLARTVRAAATGNGEASAARAELAGLIGRIRQAIAESFEVPVNSVTFVRPGTFPRTSSGKVQRRACRDGLIGGTLDVVHEWAAVPPEVEATRRHDSPDEPPPPPPLPPGMLDPAGSRRKADEIIGWLRDYAGRRLNSRVIDERRCVPPYVVLDFGLRGLFGLQVPTTSGGVGLTTTDTLRVLEQLAAIDLTLCLMVGNHNGLGTRTILKFGTEGLTADLLPLLAAGRQLGAFALTEPGAGSNPLAIQTTARRVAGGWVVRGEKKWIGLASWAGVITTFARSIGQDGGPGGIVALAVREGTPGLRHGPESLTMGIRGIVQNTVYFEDAFVPDECRLGEPGQGMAVAQDAMMFCRLALSAFAIGGMKRCAQVASRYADRRSVAAGRLLDHPITLARLEDIAAAIAATEALAYEVAAWLDAGREVPVEAYIACKTTGPELLGQAADATVQLLGGRGFTETNIVPQLFRDARVLRIFEGPTETLNGFLGSNVLQRGDGIWWLIAEGFGQPSLAEDLRNAVEHFQTLGTGVALRQAAHHIGEMASAAILAGAAAKRGSADGFAAAAARWAAERFDRVRREALTAVARPAYSPTALLDHIAGYASTIGDIEQTLPGEDTALDPLLSISETTSHTPYAYANGKADTDGPVGQGLVSRAAPEAVVASVAETIRSCVLAWLRAEVDPTVGKLDDDTPFTALGLDSVGAASVALAVGNATGRRLTPDVVYEHQTINRLATFLGGETSQNTDSCVDGRVGAARVPGGATFPPATGGTRGRDLLNRALEQTGRFRSMKEKGTYFFETTFDSVRGTSVVAGDRKMLMFSSFSYLGLIGHPEVNEAVRRATEEFGAGCHGARLIAGTTRLHRELEQELAKFVRSESSMVFNTGYVTNLATVAALAGPGDVVIGDEYNHASLADGCKFSDADFVTFRHNDTADLEKRLRAAGDRGKLVIVDAVYSMEGDIAPLPEIVRLCDRYDALLMVDEAHSLGVLGAAGRGVQEHFGLPADAIDIKMGTLSKSLGSCGGYIAGRSEVIDHLKHTARGFVFSVATPVPQVAAALTALHILQREPGRVARLMANTARITRGLRAAGLRLTDTVTPIVPVLCRTEDETLRMAAACRREGVFVIPVVYPAVPMNAPRLRISVVESHTEEELDRAVEVLTTAWREVCKF